MPAGLEGSGKSVAQWSLGSLYCADSSNAGLGTMRLQVAARLNGKRRTSKQNKYILMAQSLAVAEDQLHWTTGGDVARYSPFLVEAACPWGLAVLIRACAELPCQPQLMFAVLTNEGINSKPAENQAAATIQSLGMLHDTDRTTCLQTTKAF